MKKSVFWLIAELPKTIICMLWYHLCMLLPLEEKVIATTFKGKKYGDNPQYICEAIHKSNPNIRIIWLKNPSSHYNTPEWISTIDDRRSFYSIFHFATAKVIIDSHHFRLWSRKRQGQLFIQTWHGGLGIKKLELEVPEFQGNTIVNAMVNHTNEVADVFISQSDFLSSIYRSAFDYKGTIFKCGFPKSDILIHPDGAYRNFVRDSFNLSRDEKLLLYVPTYRSSFYQHLDFSCYFKNFDVLQNALESRFGGKWKILVRWHPIFAEELTKAYHKTSNSITDATTFSDIQKLLLGVDAVMSDYSSCLFDAALLNIPSFIYATDFDEYKTGRGVYFEMEDLPFLFARNDDELLNNIKNYDHAAFLKRWYAFKESMGLFEPGNASEVIANKILEFMETGKTQWTNSQLS